MDLKGIIAITGMSGLYKVVAQAKNGFIVESLADRKRFPIASTQRISALEDISVYAVDEDIPLSKIFVKMKESGTASPDNKADNKALSAYFRSVLPNFDESRVYASDIKKIISWYGILKDQVSFTEESVAGGEDASAPAVEEKPKAKAKKETAAPKGGQKVKAETAKKGEPAKMRKKV
jgi:hypothetical protein